jgi:hypothetical protein
MAFKFRRGVEADRTGITPAAGEPIYTTDKNKFYIGDGATAGGILVAGDARFITATAGEILGGNRVVRIADDGTIYYASCAEITHRSRIVGITRGALALAASGDVQTYGLMIEPGWTWTIGSPIYLTTNGNLTQTPPSSVFLIEVGYPMSATSMFIRIGDAVVLA